MAGLLKKFSFELKRRILGRARLSEEVIEDALQELFQNLIEQDVDFEVAEKIVERIKERLLGREASRQTKVEELVSQAILELVDESLLNSARRILEVNKKPYVIVFFGINGSGKTTAIAKTAKLLLNHGKSVVLAAGDTFRAASIEQLEEHARKLGVRLIRGTYGQDPASVIYEAVEYAKRFGIQYVLADTSGRVPTNENLMRELKKIVNVISPDRNVLVLDLTQGRDIYEQIGRYSRFVPITDFLFTKYDVDRKLGVILSSIIVYRKPIFFVSAGQGYEDIYWLKKEDFLEL